MILGANVGFVLGISGSILGDCTWPTALWHASLAALITGVLSRWWGRVWFASLHDSIAQQRRTRANALAATKTIAKV
jgi:hypothetical protein